MKTFVLYLGQQKLLEHQAENKLAATNYFREYAIRHLDKKGLYGCKIYELEEDEIRLRELKKAQQIEDSLYSNAPKKKCEDCREVKTINNFYTQKIMDSQGVEREIIKPYCKPCTIDRSVKWAEENPDRRKELKNKHNKKESEREKRRISGEQRRESGQYREWQKNNSDKLYEYAMYRKANKSHDISEQEWYECLDYFNVSCAYCGLSEEDHIRLHNQQLHKEHVEHDGSNDITNCVPSCKPCNSSKWESELNEWYNSENPVYSKRRYNKIVNWILSFAEEKDIS